MRVVLLSIVAAHLSCAGIYLIEDRPYPGMRLEMCIRVRPGIACCSYAGEACAERCYQAGGSILSTKLFPCREYAPSEPETI